jgi:DNA invertase Pin-like site-specific DNA recombinase
VTNISTSVEISVTGIDMANTGKFVAYYRVSTQRQGRSGLGLDAQKETVRNYLNGGDWQLVAEFTEVESGKRSDRPEFAKALAACRLHRATLVIAKLDRLSRNVHFVSNLMESGVEFVAVDFPQANKLTIHIIAAVAEHEAAMISQRTKDALAAAKKRGKVLGGFRGKVPTAKDRARSTEALQRKADARASDLAPTIAELQAAGKTSLRAIAEGLNELGIPTARGTGQWSATQVMRVLDRPFEASASV